jgi:mono/diheme cytochrome c family protein
MKKFIAPLALIWVAAFATMTGPSTAVGAAAQTNSGTRTPNPLPAAGYRLPAEGDAAFLKQYCITCHNSRARQGNLAIDEMDISNVGAHAEVWEKVVRKLKTGMMPPTGMPRPDRPVLDAFAASLETRLDRAGVAHKALDTPALHRLNRVEYGNAIRDLLALEIDVTPLLPSDASGEGFDNIAEALGSSPALVQGYVSAAMKISRLAIGDRTMASSQIVYSAPPSLAQDSHIEGLPLGTRGGMLIKHTFPLDAEYEFAVGGGGQGGPAGGLDFTIDGEKVNLPNPRGSRIKVTAGPHTIGVALLDRRRAAGVDEVYSDFRMAASPTTAGGIQTIGITGPFNPTGVGDTPSRRAILTCTPAAPAEEVPCARKILTSLARRAYRGSVVDADITTLMGFYQQGRNEADFESGMQHALARLLISPKFIYRAEQEPARLAAGATYRLSDVDLASRLSFFLWSSIPDDELLTTAASGKLREPMILERQVRRMLKDPKADALVKNFAGQWLYLRDLANVQTEAKNFDDNLRQSFRQETEMLFETIVRDDRSILELVDADYTFVDERLARHYGIPNVRGSHFRRVTLAADSPRRGLLGQGSMLTVTSIATRTSPVSRGKWILENLLGAPPPEPPPGVETDLGEGTEEAKTTSLRQRLEAHRRSPQCAGCHRIMDPLGFSLENFDLVGTWREFDGPVPIDNTGQLADGTQLKGPADVRAAILSRSETMVTTATEKLMTYALGRPVHYYDMPTVRSVVRRAAKESNRFSALVLGIIESDSFQKRIVQERIVQERNQERNKG